MKKNENIIKQSTVSFGRVKISKGYKIEKVFHDEITVKVEKGRKKL